MYKYRIFLGSFLIIFDRKKIQEEYRNLFVVTDGSRAQVLHYYILFYTLSTSNNLYKNEIKMEKDYSFLCNFLSVCHLKK